MVSSSTKECSAISDLPVRGVSQPTQIEVKKCHTQDVMSADRTHIPTRDTAKGWAHLKEIVHEMSASGMLIGHYCPRALAPQRSLRLIKRTGKPYTIQKEIVHEMPASGMLFIVLPDLHPDHLICPVVHFLYEIIVKIEGH